MAKRRKLFMCGSSGSKVAQARFAAMKKAEAKGIENKVVGYLKSAMSVQQVKEIEERFNLNAA